MNAKEQAKHLIEQLPDDLAGEVVDFIEFLAGKRRKADPVLRSMEEAAEDDEPTTTEDLEEMKAAEADVAAGKVYTLDDARRELGLA